MRHVLSEGSKWSGWVRPCGLSPCAPRYYYSTPRCTLVYSCVLSCSFFCVLCFCVVLCPLSCGVPCVLPALPVVWLRGAVAVVCGCVLPLLSLPLWMCATVCPVLPVSCLPYFLGIIPALYMGVLHAGLVHSLYTCPIFRLAIYDPFCTHSKSRPLDSECGFPKVGLNFRCSVFLFAEFSPVKFPA